MDLPKLIIDLINDYLEPPFVYVLESHKSIKIYDPKHLTKLVKDMFDDAYQYNRTIHEIECFSYQLDQNIEGTRFIFRLIEDFPYDFFKYKQIQVSFSNITKLKYDANSWEHKRTCFSCTIKRYNMNNLQ
jgi:aldehyde:ferredoxin oxidoreductase